VCDGIERHQLTLGGQNGPTPRRAGPCDTIVADRSALSSAYGGMPPTSGNGKNLYRLTEELADVESRTIGLARDGLKLSHNRRRT